jgi:hypothetical protein
MRAFLASLLEDAAGGFSTLRLALLTWLAAVGAVFVGASINAGAVADLPPGIVTFTGILVGSKVIQRYGEGGPGA